MSEEISLKEKAKAFEEGYWLAAEDIKKGAYVVVNYDNLIYPLRIISKSQAKKDLRIQDDVKKGDKIMFLDNQFRKWREAKYEHCETCGQVTNKFYDDI